MTGQGEGGYGRQKGTHDRERFDRLAGADEVKSQLANERWCARAAPRRIFLQWPSVIGHLVIRQRIASSSARGKELALMSSLRQPLSRGDLGSPWVVRIPHSMSRVRRDLLWGLEDPETDLITDGARE
jgi:hypothetical protein